MPLHCILLYYISRVKNYIGGIKGNLNMMPVYYPGWIMRLYVDFGQLNQFRYKEIKDELCEIACTYPNFDICDASNLPGTPAEDASKIFPKNWRFFPTLDPQVKNSNGFEQKVAQKRLQTPGIIQLISKGTEQRHKHKSNQ